MADPDSSADARSRLALRLGWTFRDPELLRQALVHRSFCAEHPGERPNERFEFLGDAVLGLAVTDAIFRDYPDLPEGELAKLRASVVSGEPLAELARDLELGEALLLGKGEAASGGRDKPSILADAMEAVIASVYLDGGMEPAAALVLGRLGPQIATAAEGPGGRDWKTRLQEETARRFDRIPRYTMRAEGPDHAKRFFATVTVEGITRGSGEGHSKKHAEQQAAHEAWEWIRGLDRGGDGERVEPDTGAGGRNA